MPSSKGSSRSSAEVTAARARKGSLKRAGTMAKLVRILLSLAPSSLSAAVYLLVCLSSAYLAIRTRLDRLLPALLYCGWSGCYCVSPPRT